MAFAGESPLGQRLRQGAQGAPLLEALWAPAFTRSVLLAGAMPPARAARDPMLFHGTPAADGAVQFVPRAGSTEPLRSVNRQTDGRFKALAREDGPPREEDALPAYLALDGAVSPEALVELLEALPGQGLWPVLAVDAVPGNPAAPAAPPAPGAIGAPLSQELSDEIGAMFGAREREAPPPKGELDKELVRKVVQRHLGDVRSCYEQSLKRAPTLSGKVTVAFIISATGEVASARVETSTAQSPELEACLVNRVLSWRFPEPYGGEVAVAYPFVFTPAN